MRKVSQNTKTKGSTKPRPNKKQGRKRYSERVAEKEAVESSTNDPAWYASSPELLRDAASIPFSWPSGTTMGTAGYLLNDVVPGIATIDLQQVIGASVNKNSAVNVASDAIYSFVRHANSGHSNYDAPDLMMYLLGMSSVYAFITWCQRLLGLVMTYDQRNRYIPDALLKANYVNPNSLRSNIANFRFWLNTFVSKVSSFAIPNVMPYFSRMAFLYSNYYIEGPTIKDQLYMYVPANLQFLKFEIDETTSLGSLVYSNINRSGTEELATVEDIENFGNTLFNAMWSQEDFGIMSGDILKAYGDSIIKLAPVPEMFIMQPVYDTMFLHQFKNAKVLHPAWIEVSKIFQNPEAGTINQTIMPTSQLGEAAINAVKDTFGESNFILSSDFESPTPEVVIESTRLMPVYKPSAIIFETGSEIPVGVNYYRFIYTGSDVTLNCSAESMIIVGSNLQSIEGQLVDRQYFKYAPEVHVGQLGTQGWNYLDRNAYRFWEIDNYAVLSSEDLSKMHTAALMSMLAVPSIAKI